MFGHFHAHWREPVSRDRRSVHAGVSKVTESRFPIDCAAGNEAEDKGRAPFRGALPCIKTTPHSIEPCRGNRRAGGSSHV